MELHDKSPPLVAPIVRYVLTPEVAIAVSPALAKRGVVAKGKVVAQIAIAADDDPGASRKSELQILVILGISAIRNAYRGLEPDGHAS